MPEVKTWSDKLKEALKPNWMIERDKQRPADAPDWRPGHLLWVATVGSPAEMTALSKQINHAVAPSERSADDVIDTTWRERERARRSYQASKEKITDR